MFAEDLAAFFDTVNGFGEIVSYNGAPVRAIFDAAFIEARLGEVGMESIKPSCVVLDSEVPAPAHEDNVVRKGIAYRVIPPIEPDGTGLTLLRLEKQ